MKVIDQSLRRSFRRVRIAGFAIFWGLALQGLALAADPSINVVNSPVENNYQTYINQLNALIISNTTEQAVGLGSGTTHFFDLNQPLIDIPGFAELPSTDRALMTGAKNTYDLYRALGGSAVTEQAVLEAGEGGYFLALDGEGGRWVATPAEALTLLVQQLAAHQYKRIHPGSAGLPCPFNFECLLRATYTGDVETLAFVPRSTTLDLIMKGDGFSNSDSVPVIVAAQGLVILSVTFIDSETLMARLTVSSDTPTGLSVLDVFNAESPFKSHQRYGLNVVGGLDQLQALYAEIAAGSDTGDGGGDDRQLLEGTGSVELLSDDHGNQPSAASPLVGFTAGRIETSDDVDVFKITLPTAGKVSISSSGPTDVFGALEDASGAVIASDEDSGSRYNFSLTAQVEASTYYLKVSHCCAGDGHYQLQYDFSAD